MNIIVVTNDGINISSLYSSKYHYLLFKLDWKDLNFKSNKISDLVNKTKQVGRFIKETKLNELLTSNHKKNVFITKNLSTYSLKNLRNSGIETYITFKKSVNEALNQYYSGLLMREKFCAKNK